MVVDYKSFCHLTILLLSLCFMVVHCSADPADQFLDNPTEGKQDSMTMHKRPSFYVGSRYGRSGASTSSTGGSYAPSKTRRLNVVPRNDRFFLGSRYGKRAGTLNFNKEQPLASTVLSTPYEQALFSEISTGTQLSNKPGDDLYSENNWDSNANNNNNNSPGNFYMSCFYTGLQNFYRCNSIYKMMKIKNATPHYVNDAAYEDDNGHGFGDDNNDDDDNNGIEVEEEEQGMGADDTVNQVLSTAKGVHINVADIRKHAFKN